MATELQNIDAAAGSVNVLSTILGSNCVTLRSGGATWVYVFYINGSARPVYKKSTDGGVTFGTEVVLDATKTYLAVSIWWDQWTPSDTTGTVIHIAASSNSTNALRYFAIDTAAADAQTANSDAQINTSTTISPNSCPAICKAVDDVLYTAQNYTTTAGNLLSKSSSPYATWTDITTPAGGNDMAADLNGVNDYCLLSPLKTDDDIILYAVRAGHNTGDYWIYDAVAGEWSTSTKLSDSDELTFHGQQISCAVDKATGDQYIVYIDGAYTDPTANVEFVLLTDSGRVLGTPQIIKNGLPDASVAETQNMAIGITRDETNGILMVGFIQGGIGFSIPYLALSSDSGVTWSSWFAINNVSADDYRSIFMPPVMNDVAEGWFLVTGNEDTAAVQALLNTLEYETYSGVVYDNDGATPVVGANVEVYRAGYWRRSGPHGGYGHFCGISVSDGLGNYLTGVFPNYAGDAGTPLFFARVHQEGASDVDDKSDCSFETEAD